MIRIDPPLTRRDRIALGLMIGGFIFFILATAAVELRIQETSAQAWQARQEVRRGRR